MEFLQNLADNTQFPLFTAFILGLMTAVSPCPLATNISAIGFISKDIQDKRKTFINGLVYTLGRTISYTVLGIILILILKQGSSIFQIQRAIGNYGELFIGPLLIVIGVFMLDLIKFNFSLTGGLSDKMESKTKKGSWWSSLLLGIVFALAFCPYSGVIYFGGLIPLAVSSNIGYLLPVVFAIATGLPVILFAWILTFSVSSVGKMYNKIKTFEFWFRRIAAVIFILVGLYYIWLIYL
ncbi:aromatic aminobenezylarsenical efflux permease ArsG family transporter [Alkalitalea saponilacus]|uniref:Cytochrome C biogenesis protein transmembrane region n=1 Tax=Alkalitalea saponilacus TaxID=889453 RepID=A0A1T5HT77_9BACT|nr:aromatic aminobenezylarsenical efflux permease ArsG family transporter [Alkalitalea saponilacus]ASB49235.1 cytochrome C biogenesis protein [Alkalitalea saponilacus]SKC23720.1 Cytochrome C biogenesis protein transmembrane region [Alkalitalea saponilacus]